MISDFELLFICLLPIYIFSLEKNVYLSHLPILNELSLLLLLSCRSSSNILDIINPLPDVWFGIFSSIPWVAFSHCFLMHKKFQCTKDSKTHFSISVFLVYLFFFFWCYIQKIIAKLDVMKLCVVFMQEFYSLGLMFTFNLLILWTEKPGRL